MYGTIALIGNFSWLHYDFQVAILVRTAFKTASVPSHYTCSSRLLEINFGAM